MTQRDHLREILTSSIPLDVDFSMHDVRRIAVPEFEAAYPNNNSVVPTILRLLQELRDEGTLQFLDNNGRYRRIGGAPTRAVTPRDPEAITDSRVVRAMLSDPASDLDDDFEPETEEDARSFMLRSVARREGQREFRESLIAHFDGACAMSGFDALPALEAAHIAPYRGPRFNRLGNGLLLRGDLHTLFDKHLISVDPDARLWVSASLAGTRYWALSAEPTACDASLLEEARRALLLHHTVCLQRDERDAAA